ncbi:MULTISPECIES: DUF711 family protein [Pectobacterium]|uniref:DUF711 family protein n=1 Tax=Pectobacterium TaxID=122277 RepID=UPI000D72C32A|nr:MULTISPECIES: DUF711 family protein [Pectobacterium]PXB01625.1 DUF711 domain-containing protein [Pectobacterium carotovorum subsp. carotovorum]
MDYKEKALCKIRTVTTFLSLSHDKESWQTEINKASKFLSDLMAEFQRHHYTVQSIRIVTNPFGEYLNLSSIENARADLHYISELLAHNNHSGVRVRFAIGEAKTTREIEILPDLINEFGDLCNACVNIPLDGYGIVDNELIKTAASCVKKISIITPRGEGNFNFTVNFNCKPLIPYFPAGYHKKELGDCFVIGLETPDLLVNTLKTFNKEKGIKNHNELFSNYYTILSTALQYHISAIKNIITHAEMDFPFKFSGFDSSAAPSKNCASMAEVYEQMGVEYFGASGTVEASGLLTKVFKSVKETELVGFSGLMLALTEDQGLANGSVKSNFDIRALLTYSAVCGIGLDTVPVPGDVSIDKLSALMRDTGTMAFRLNKPLTVRVFPVPGMQAGDITNFESDDLCNCAVLAVP